MTKHDARDTVLLLSHPTRLASDSDRRFGFIQKIEEDYKHLKILHTPELPVTDDEIHKAIVNLLSSDIDADRVAAIYGTGGIGTAGVISALKSLGLSEKIPMLVHDLTDVHQEVLSRNEVAYVLDQDIQYCVSAAAKVLRGLCENVRGAIQVPRPRIEILTSENYH